MFITHGEKVRKHAPIVFGIIVVIVALGMVVTYGPSMMSGSRRGEGEEEVPTVRGKTIPATEYERVRRDVHDQLVITSGREIPSTPEAQEEWRRQAAIQWLLLRKAQELGIRVSEESLERWVAVHPIFRNERGQFDPERYRQFTTLLLSRFGITETRFLEVMRGEVILGQLRDWIGAGAKITPQEAQLSYVPLRETMFIDAVQFEMNNNHDVITVTDTDAKNFFDTRKESFRKPALVKVRYAVFAVDAFKKAAKVTDADVQTYFNENRFRYPQAALVTTNTTATSTNSVNVINNIVTAINSNALPAVFAEIRADLLTTDARRRAGEAAQNLAVKLAPDLVGKDGPAKTRPDFAKLAADLGATVKETDYFTGTDNVPGVTGRKFNDTAFWLARRPDPPFSDAVEDTDAFYVLEYLDSKPSRIPDFAEAKEQVINHIKENRRYDATVQQGRESLDNLRKLLADGHSFSNACTELKLKTDSYGPFTATDTDFAAPAAARIQQAALGMVTNTVSEFITTATGGIFFFLKERRPGDPAAYELERPRITQQLLQRARRAIFDSWVQNLVKEEQVDFGKPRQRPVPVPEPEDQSAEPSPASTNR